MCLCVIALATIACSGKKQEADTAPQAAETETVVEETAAEEIVAVGARSRNRMERDSEGRSREERGERRRPDGQGLERGERRRPDGQGPERGEGRRPDGQRPERGERSRPDGQGPERGRGRGNAEAQAALAAQEPLWYIGNIGPNSGYVYFVDYDTEEFYEAFPPHSAVGVNDSLPSGWVTPDMEDLSLIYAGLQIRGIADYGANYYISVNKSEGKNYYLRMSDGDRVLGAPQGRKIGVRAFDASQAPAGKLLAASGFTQSAPAAAVATAPAASTARYQIGDTGPNGGIVFSVSGGKYKEITKPGKEDSVAAMGDRYFEYQRIYAQLYDEALEEQARTKAAYDDNPTSQNNALYEEATNKLNNVGLNVSVSNPFSGWRWATMPELIEVYDLFKKTGKLNFANVAYGSSSTIDYRNRGEKYSRGPVAYIPGLTDTEAPFLFPGVRFIPMGGGPSENHVMDMRDGEIFLVCIEDIFNIGVEHRAGFRIGEKGLFFNDLLIPMVKEF